MKKVKEKSEWLFGMSGRATFLAALHSRPGVLFCRCSGAGR